MPSTRSRPITVVLIEDDALVRARLAHWLSPDSGFQCIGAFKDAETALASMARLRPEIAVLDFGLPGMTSIEFLWQIKANWPSIRVLALSHAPGDEMLFAALAAGADGFLDQPVRPDNFLNELRELFAGRIPLSQRARQFILDHFRKFGAGSSEDQPLTQREQAVLRLLKQDLRAKEIADRLGLSPHTIYMHLQNIYRKLHVHGRREAVWKTLGTH